MINSWNGTIPYGVTSETSYKGCAYVDGADDKDIEMRLYLIPQEETTYDLAITFSKEGKPIPPPRTVTVTNNMGRDEPRRKLYLCPHNPDYWRIGLTQGFRIRYSGRTLMSGPPGTKSIREIIEHYY